MTFEEQFPVAKEYLLFGEYAKEGRKYIDWMDLEEYCLDKQRVKEIVEDLLCDYQEEASTKWSSEEERYSAIVAMNALERLLKDLGLKDE